MRRAECPRCGLEIIGTHQTVEDCLAHLRPRYALAQRALAAIHRRCRSLEDRLERAKIQERTARKEAARGRTVEGRLQRLERWMESVHGIERK